MNKNLKELLYAKDILIDIYDVIRLVDAENCMILNYNEDGTFSETGTYCTEVLGRSLRCQNCISMRAAAVDKPVAKMEFHNSAIWLAISIPVNIQGRNVLVELLKDISKSLVFDTNKTDSATMNNISETIDRLNLIAITDSLTNVFNRRYINEQLPGLLFQYSEMRKHIHIGLLDIDNFKMTNDVFGHVAGDYVLSEIARQMKSHLRKDHDWIARYGGEEFLIFLADIDTQEAYKILERVRKSIENAPVLYEGEKIYITASIGLCKSRPGDTMESIIKRCDDMLYQAKSNGKNRIECA